MSSAVGVQCARNPVSAHLRPPAPTRAHARRTPACALASRTPAYRRMNLVQRARPGVVLARALEGDVEAVAVDEVATSTLASVLPSVGVACLGSLLFGYHLAVVNPALAPLSLELGISAARTQGFVVSAALVGACVGSFQAGALADTLGRRGALRVASVPLLLGALACGAAPSTGALLAGRLLAGLGLGLASGVVPVYISEVAPPALRGALGSANQLCICLGLLAAIVAGLPVAANPELWRACFYAAALPAALLMLGSGLILESPAWAARKPGGEAGASGWAELGCAQHRRATVLAVGLFALQQLAGINAVVFFSNAVFKAAGVQSEVLASSGVALVNVLGTLVAARVVDQAGRKPLLLGSFTGSAPPEGGGGGAAAAPRCG